MEREIEFKAWHIEEKKMCDVSVINLNKGAFLIGVKPGPDSFDEEDSEEEFNQTPQNGRFCYFDEFELLQFTGLTDKNGVKVFEGDILKRKDGISFIVWCLDGWRYNSWMPESMELYHSVDKTKGKNYEIAEVIGNIHDNPELLK